MVPGDCVITSKNTSINQLPAIAKKADKLHGWVRGTRNLDIGAGKYDEFTKYLRRKGIENFPYDPYNRSAVENFLALSCGPYTTITISNVLNVIESQKDRAAIIQLAAKMLSPGGSVFITVYEGNGGGIGGQSKKDCWQENRPTLSYVSEVTKVFDGVVVSDGMIICRSRGTGKSLI
jgi:hypothetical protein